MTWTPSRRTVLRMLAASGASLLLPRRLLAAPAPALFEEVPPERSGITFVHENAMSAERYLPETMGPGCAFLDYDNDGWMDVYIVNSGPADFYTPKTPLRNALYHNNRDGTFTEVSKGTAIGAAMGKALGVVATDINNDGLMDLFVANDTVQNFLFVNRGQGKWEEIGLPAEVGFSANGQVRSGMGVDAADFDGDGWQDLFVANVDQEMFSLYKNNKDETFTDLSYLNSIADATRLLSG